MPMPFSNIRKVGDAFHATATFCTHNDYGIINGSIKEDAIIPIKQPEPAHKGGVYYVSGGREYRTSEFRARDGSGPDPDYIKFRKKLSFPSKG